MIVLFDVGISLAPSDRQTTVYCTSPVWMLRDAEPMCSVGRIQRGCEREIEGRYVGM